MAEVLHRSQVTLGSSFAWGDTSLEQFVLEVAIAPYIRRTVQHNFGVDTRQRFRLISPQLSCPHETYPASLLNPLSLS